MYPLASRKLIGGLGHVGGASYIQQILNLFGSSIIAYFPLNDTSGTTMTDVKNARNGTYAGTTGPTLGQPPIRDGQTSVYIPSANAWCNAFTTGFRDAWNGAEGTVMVDVQVNSASNWTDNTARYACHINVDGSNYIRIYKDLAGSPNYINWIYRAGGTSNTRTKTGTTETGRMHLAITWSKSNNRVRAYYNGAQEGADLTGLGTWAGTLTTAVFGAFAASNSAMWYGWMQNALVLDREATPAEVASVNSFSLGAVDAPAAGGFSVVFLPDTQAMVQTAAYRAGLTQMMDWIVENKTALNIQAVAGVGDVVETAGTAAEWVAADASFDVLDTDGTVPYLVAAGDHDSEDIDNHVYTAFNTYFPQSRYTARSWWAGGFYEASHSENAYNILTIEGQAYIFIQLEARPRAAVLTWFDGLLTTHADKKAIVTSHAYLTSSNARDPYGDSIWDKIKLHDNVIWVGCGNYVDPDGYGRLTSQTNGGKDVHQVLFDTQTLEYGGPWLRVVKFHPGGQIISQTYSPISRQLMSDSDNEFSLDYPA